MNRLPVIYLQILFLVLLLASCTANNPPFVNQTNTEIPQSSSPTSAANPSATPIATTPTPEPRWIAYEKALADAIITYSDAICEWDILGQNGQEVYVWAVCRDQHSIGEVSVPAVIYLEDNGELRVVLPRDGRYAEDIRQLFPADVQGFILRQLPLHMDIKTAEEHLELRLQDAKVPPLIVSTRTPLP